MTQSSWCGKSIRGAIVQPFGPDGLLRVYRHGDIHEGGFDGDIEIERMGGSVDCSRSKLFRGAALVM